MRAILRTIAAAGMLATSSAAAAQDVGDIAAWYAMMVTPFGALPPMVTPTMAGMPAAGGGRPVSLDFRYGHWDFGGGEEPWNTFGVGGRVGSFGIVLGYEECEDCSDGVLMGGADFEAALASSQYGNPASPSSLMVGVRPSIGYADPMGDIEGNAFSATVELPVSFSIPVGTGSRLIPFASPGFGYGRFNDSDPDFVESESGTRASLAAGVGFLTSGGFGLHLGWRKIFIDEGPGIVGVGVSFGR